MLSLAQAKAAVLAGEPIWLKAKDRKLLKAMVNLLRESTGARMRLLLRWKLRRLMETLAEEHGIELPSQELGSKRKP